MLHMRAAFIFSSMALLSCVDNASIRRRLGWQLIMHNAGTEAVLSGTVPIQKGLMGQLMLHSLTSPRPLIIFFHSKCCYSRGDCFSFFRGLCITMLIPCYPAHPLRGT